MGMRESDQNLQNKHFVTGKAFIRREYYKLIHKRSLKF